MTALTQHLNPGSTTGDPDTSGMTGGRDPAHALYEQAAGLLATAQALEAATHAPGAVAAVAPTLACVEASLLALAGATQRLRTQALERLSDPVFAPDDTRARRADVALYLGRLAGVLEQGSLASEDARASLVPVLDELTMV
jgi:hypothetical protein